MDIFFYSIILVAEKARGALKLQRRGRAPCAPPPPPLVTSLNGTFIVIGRWPGSDIENSLPSWDIALLLPHRFGDRSVARPYG